MATSGELFVCRRAFLIGLVAALLPSPALAQKTTTPTRLGWLSAGSEPDPFLAGFRDGLRSLGYVEGQNVVLASRPGGNLTGSTFLSLEIAGKRVELLKQAVPHLRSLAVL